MMQDNQPKQLVLLFDASAAVGAGHAVRMLALAQEWKRRGDSIIAMGRVHLEWVVDAFLDEGIDIVQTDEAINGSTSNYFFELLKKKYHLGRTWVCIDAYGYSAELPKQLMQKGFRVLLMDDLGEKSGFEADIILNQNVGAASVDYAGDSLKLLGEKYVLLRDEILKLEKAPRQHKSASALLLAFGGGDSTDAFLSIIRDISQMNNEVDELQLLLIPGASNSKILRKAVYDVKLNCKFLDVSSDLKSFYLQAKGAIVAAGSTCYELAYLRIPFLFLQTAENQSLVAQGLIDNDFAQTYSTAVGRNFLLGLSGSSVIMGRDTLVDGKGKARVLEAIHGYR